MAIDRAGEGACDIGRPVAVIARFDARPSDEQCHQRAALGQQGKPAVAQQAPYGGQECREPEREDEAPQHPSGGSRWLRASVPQTVIAATAIARNTRPMIEDSLVTSPPRGPVKGGPSPDNSSQRQAPARDLEQHDAGRHGEIE